jgi:hypothetical protein
VNININNSNSIVGYVASLQINSTRGGTYIDRDASLETADARLLHLAAMGTVSDLRRAVITTSDFFTAEITLRDVDALVNEKFWSALGIDVQAEFVIVSTGHGILETSNARLLVKTQEVI